MVNQWINQSINRLVNRLNTTALTLEPDRWASAAASNKSHALTTVADTGSLSAPFKSLSNGDIGEPGTSATVSDGNVDRLFCGDKRAARNSSIISPSSNSSNDNSSTKTGLFSAADLGRESPERRSCLDRLLGAPSSFREWLQRLRKSRWRRSSSSPAL